MAIESEIRLIDGPLIDSAARIRVMVERMAEGLVASDTFRDPRDAMMTLRAAGYPAFAVMRLVSDARQAAVQSIVAREMADT